MTNLARIVCALLLFTASAAHSQCLNLVAADANSRYEFLNAVIRSLGEFKAAQEAAASIAKATTPTDILVDIDIQGEKLQCASDRLNTFKSAEDEKVKSATKAFQDTAMELSQLNSIAKEQLVKELNGDADEKPGDRASRLALLTKQFRDAWDLLPLATAASILASVEFESPNTHKLGRLAITRPELAQLNASLETFFPGVSMRGEEKDANQSELAALLLYIGLNKKGWPTHEQPFPSQTSSGT